MYLQNELTSGQPHISIYIAETRVWPFLPWKLLLVLWQVENFTFEVHGLKDQTISSISSSISKPCAAPNFMMLLQPFKSDKGTLPGLNKSQHSMSSKLIGPQQSKFAAQKSTNTTKTMTKTKTNYSQHSISAKLIGPQPSKCTAQESINTIKTKTTSSKLITRLLHQKKYQKYQRFKVCIYKYIEDKN